MQVCDIEVLYLIILAQLGKEVITKVSFERLNSVYLMIDLRCVDVNCNPGLHNKSHAIKHCELVRGA